MHKFLHPALLASLGPHGNTEKNQPSTSLQGPAIPTKCTCDPGKKPRNQSLGQWRAEMVLNLFLQTLSVTIPYLRLFVPLRAAGTICSSECCGELCSRAHFPRGSADPEAQAPAWALPLPIPSWLCAFHTLSANLDLKSRLNHSNCSYSSSTQTNQHQHFQSRSFTLMQLVKSR